MSEQSPIVTKADAKKYDIPGGVCYLYPDCPTGRLSCAYVEQVGRYPEQGFRKNLKCTEAMFIIDGDMTFIIDGKTFPVKPHDVVYVPLNTPYAVEGTGRSLVFIEPKWESDQNVPC